MSSAAGLRGLILAAPLLMAVPCTAAQAVDAPSGPLSGIPPAAHGALPASEGEGRGEDAIQTVPFLAGSGLILLAVLLVFRRTLLTDQRLERARRSRFRPTGHPGRPGAPAPRDSGPAQESPSAPADPPG